MRCSVREMPIDFLAFAKADQGAAHGRQNRDFSAVQIGFIGVDEFDFAAVAGFGRDSEPAPPMVTMLTGIDSPGTTMARSNSVRKLGGGRKAIRRAKSISLTSRLSSSISMFL